MTDRIYLSPHARATILWIAVGIILLFLWQVGEILTPFIWAIVTAYVLTPVTAFLARRTGLPRRLWAVLVYVVLLGLLVWGLGTLLPLLSQQATELSKELPRHFREAGRMLGQSEFDVLGVTIDLNATDAEISRQIGQLLSRAGRDILPSAIPRLAGSFLKLLVYLVATFFLLMEADRIGQGIRNLTPPTARTELEPWVRRIDRVLGAYIRGQLFLVLLMSVTSYIALELLHVRFAPLLAIFTGLVETLPFIGPYTAGGTAVLVALTQGSAPYGWSPIVLAIVVAGTYTLLRQLEDNFVMPFLIGRLVHLHPLLVIFAVLSGAAIGGILGLLVAVPVAATLKIAATYLYGKLREEPARTLVMIEPDDDWERIAERVRDGVIISKASGASRPRLLISMPNPPLALLDPAQFHRLPALLAEAHTDAVLITSDEVLCRLAEAAGIPTEPGPESEIAAPPDPDFEEGEVHTLLNRRNKVPGEGVMSRRRMRMARPKTGKDIGL